MYGPYSLQQPCKVGVDVSCFVCKVACFTAFLCLWALFVGLLFLGQIYSVNRSVVVVPADYHVLYFQVQQASDTAQTCKLSCTCSLYSQVSPHRRQVGVVG